MNFDTYAHSKFGNYVKRHNRYLDMRKKLRSAHIFTQYEEYVSSAILISLIVATIGLILGAVIGYIISLRVQLPRMVVYDPSLGYFLSLFTPIRFYIFFAMIGALFFLMLGGIVYSIFMVYPSLQASMRKVQIDTQLPHAVTYMYALSRGETNIVEIIRSVAELPNIYGEISNEFAVLLRDMDLLGIDFMTALRNIQNETPSENFSNFIGNLISLIDHGGDITEFLGMQIENFRKKTKTEHTVFLDMLGLVAEGYVSGFVAGPLFLIIAGVTLGSMKSSMTWMLMGMTYAVLPLGSIAFIIVIDMILPKDEQQIGALNLRRVKEFLGIKITKTPPSNEKQLFEEYERTKNRIRIMNIIKNPLHAFFEEPKLSLFVSVPIALIILAIPIISNPTALFSGYVAASEYLTNYILLSLVIALVPYIVFYEIRSRKTKRIEDAIPQFLRQLSVVNESGLSLSESLRVMLRTESGALRSYIEKMYTDMVWGAGTTEAFINFANKIRTNTLSRMVALITKASESSGNIKEVLEVASEDSNIDVQLKKDKFTNMLIYVIMVYIAFIVFLYVVYTLSTSFLPQMAKAGNAGTTYSGGTTFIRGFDLEFYKEYFYHTALVQAFFSGMMAGVLGEGDYRLGFKHSIVMILIAFVLFKLLV